MKISKLAESLRQLDRSMEDVKAGRGRPLCEAVLEIAAELGLKLDLGSRSKAANGEIRTPERGASTGTEDPDQERASWRACSISPLDSGRGGSTKTVS